MKDRLSKISKRATHALCLLAACGLTYSCADEYKLDDEAPSWLGKSIYSYLEEEKNPKGEKVYTNFVRLINDLGLKDVLSTTGSRTLFVANDSSFQKFYENNAAQAAINPKYAWANATSYDKLTKAQKRLLLNSAMLNNAYLMEMLSRGEGSATRGTNMRKATTVELTDSIPVLAPEDFPTSENPVDKNYWKQHADKDTFYIVSDNSTPMMVFFSEDFMSKAGVTNDDFKFIVGENRNSGDYYIYNNKVVEKDITCQNGYIHRMEDVIVPQPNMADVIRENPNTQIFSHIMDRFSAPYYDADLTRQYKENIDNSFQDSIFVWKYYSELTNSASVRDYLEDGSLTKGPDGESPSSDFRILKLDPAWNQFTAGNGSTSDMAAMFVPDDASLKYYFQEGSGKDLLDNYGIIKNDNSLEALYTNIDQIPLSILNSFVSNLMQKSFTSSVPSKFSTILDQANDNLFTDPEKAKSEITDVEIANNGVVYVMNEVYPPVDYAAVTSPAYIGNNYKIMKFAIYNGEGSDGKKNLLNLNFYAYLRAKGDGIKFSLFLPSDEAMQNYVDPVSIIPGKESVKARILSYVYNSDLTAADKAPYTCKFYSYDVTTGTKGREGTDSEQSDDVSLNRLADILETHTIVHDTEKEPEGIRSGNEYYLSKSGSPVRVRFNGDKVQVQGGMQIENEKNYPGQSATGFYYAETEDIYEKTNGTTYCINATIQPAVKSVYKVMSELPDHLFFDLCEGVTSDILEKTGVLVYPADATTAEKQTEQNKYLVFAKQNGLDYNVTFLSKYNYTIYVPTDEAMQAEITEKGLPTWESIENFITTHEEDPNWDSVYKPIAAAQVTTLLDFIRGHFQDNSVFADQVASAPVSYNSAAINGSKFITITPEQKGQGVLVIKGNDCYDQCEVTSVKNLIARDYECDEGANFNTDDANLNKSVIKKSAYSVIHEIDGVLRTVNLGDKTYESIWETPQAAKSAVAKFRIKNK